MQPVPDLELYTSFVCFEQLQSAANSQHCMTLSISVLDKNPRGLTCICRDTGMCHYFGYLFWVTTGFLGTFLNYSRIFGYHFFAIPGFLGVIFFVKFDFFENNPDFWGIDFDILLMTLWNVSCRAPVSYFLQSDLTCSCRVFAK